VFPVLVVLMGLSQSVFLGAKATVTSQIEITKVFPLEVKRGEHLSIFGLNFGNDRQDIWLGTHRIGSDDREHLLGWSDGRIDIKIPEIVPADGYEIMVTKGGSSKIAFKGDSPTRIKILQDTNSAPSVISTDPAGQAVAISTKSHISVKFNKAIKNTTVNANSFFVKDSSNTKVPGTVTLSPDGLTATFVPSHELSPKTTYTATVTSGVTDQTGNPMASDKTWSFFTIILAPEITSPLTIVSKEPAEGAQNVDIRPAIRIVFNKKILENTIDKNNIKLLDETGTEIQDTIVLLDPSDNDKKTAMITFLNPLEKGKKYTVRVTTGVKDSGGSAMASQQQWSFVTSQA
jgi:methionine-rich copper-binding protein CopC